MYNEYDIRRLHLELTTKCNAACPQCARRINGGPINKNIPLVELTLSEIRAILPVRFLENVESIIICGLCGDPCMASEALEIIDYLQTATQKINITVCTNGSLRQEDWWINLAGILHKPSSVIFGIDGIGDTNQIYRRNTSWDIIMRNTRAFINAGGLAFWEFIVFEHNEHQLQDSVQLSKQLGFSGIKFIETERFVNYGALVPIEFTPIFNEAGIQIGQLRPPQSNDHQNPIGAYLQKAANEFGSIENYLNSVEINCTAFETRELLVTAQGFAVPCCWFGHLYYMGYENGTLTYLGDDYTLYEGDRNLLLKYNGYEAGNLKKNPVGKVLSNEFFSKTLEESWKKKKITCGKSAICSLMCGRLSDQ